MHLASCVSPAGIAHRLSRLACRFNRHHDLAALNRALILRSNPDQAWAAFEALLEQLGNPKSTSASDMLLARQPLALARKLFGSAVLGPAGRLTGESTIAKATLEGTKLLAQTLLSQALEADDTSRARRCLETIESLAGALSDSRPSGRADDRTATTKPVHSPLDALAEGRRSLADGDLDRAQDLATLAIRYLPEVGETWTLAGLVDLARERSDESLLKLRRAIALDPQQIDAFIALLAQPQLREDASIDLQITGPDAIELGGAEVFHCKVSGRHRPETLYVLPPAGRGVLPRPASVDFDSTGRARTTLEARRPHRINGGPWRLVFLAVGPTGFALREAGVAVSDESSGKVLVTVTEDHEIHEERGRMSVDLLRRVLVEKSRRAATAAPQWTHMVETGSTLALLDETAARHSGTWGRLREDVREHLVDQMIDGHDIQPHLHAFNDPAYLHFPYTIEPNGLRPSLEFLLTPADERGDWASVCLPPGNGDNGQPDRVSSVARSVTQVEDIARLADPDYRPLLWRSGLLEYGNSAADNAWSAVALRHSGLLAVSDEPKPTSAFAPARPAFTCDWSDPSRPCPGGPLLQLPIAANLEGDFVMGPGLLGRRAAKSVEALRDRSGEVSAGIHLFTLLTHDKFINARRGRDEFRYDHDYGDWPTIDRHVAAWQRAGARFVTAATGIREVLEDSTLRPIALLEQETWLASRNEPPTVRYTVRCLGRDVPFDHDWPHHLMLTIPPSLRALVRSAEVRQNGDRVAGETDLENGRLWTIVAERHSTMYCFFTLRDTPGPALVSLDRQSAGRWKLTFAASEPFRRARVLLPSTGLPAELAAVSRPIIVESATAPTGAPEALADTEGLLIYNLACLQRQPGDPKFATSLIVSAAPDDTSAA